VARVDVSMVFLFDRTRATTGSVRRTRSAKKLTPSALLSSRTHSSPNREKSNQAARRIARAWRCHVFTRAYRAARDMLLRRGGLVAARGGTPSDILPADIIHDAPLALRLANPAEATLANDRGACVHVRLRLGVHHRGSGGVGAYSFFLPPSVYYRVYTHHPVADLNALSPGAYFEDAKRRAEAYARSKNSYRSRTAYGEESLLASAMTDKSSATCRYVRIEHNDWRPLPARAARALAEDEKTLAEAALASLGGFFDATRPSTTVSASSSSSRFSSSGARRRRMRSTSASEASSARVTNRGARTDAAATRAALRRRARAWSAGGDESGGGTTEYDECVDSDDTDDELDSLLEWSEGLDFEAFDVSWREAFHGEAREAPRVE
jgi:hypothetical protein